MRLEDQCASLELCKKLKELGVKQLSYFKFEVRRGEEGGGYSEIFHTKATSCAHHYISAFTSAELGEMLPPECSTSKYTGIRSELKGMWWLCRYIYYIEDNEHPNFKAISSNTEADCRAEMLIWLIENKYMDVPK